MGGWKTWASALTLGLPGLLQVFSAVMPVFQGGALDGATLQTGLAMTGAALGVAGVGHKVEKAAATVADVTQQTAAAVQIVSAAATQMKQNAAGNS